jgi:hypothetical protein
MSRSVSLTASYAIAIAILYIVAIAFSTAARSGVTVRHKRRDSNNTITLLCQNDTTFAYIANATFLRNSRRIDNIVYGDLSGPNTSLTFNLTPQMEGSYSCRPPETRFASNNSLELAGV